VRAQGIGHRAAAGHRPLARGRLPGADRVGRCDERYVHAAPGGASPVRMALAQARSSCGSCCATASRCCCRWSSRCCCSASSARATAATSTRWCRGSSRSRCSRPRSPAWRSGRASSAGTAS
jgi:hypothetical protein